MLWSLFSFNIGFLSLAFDYNFAYIIYITLITIPIYFYYKKISGIFIAFILGSIYSHTYFYYQNNYINSLEFTNTNFEGEIIDFPKKENFGTTLKIKNLNPKDKQPKILKLTDYKYKNIYQLGCIYNFETKLKPPISHLNTGFYDSYKINLSKNIESLGSIKNSHLISCKTNIRSKYKDYLQKNEDYITQLLFLADGQVLSKDKWDIIKNTGTAHLFVVSGQHINMLSLLIFFITYIVWKKIPIFPYFNYAFILNTFLIIFYAYFAGWTVPVIRASFFMILILIFRISFKLPNLFLILNIILTVILIHNPNLIFSSGLWLSFSSSFIILRYKNEISLNNFFSSAFKITTLIILINAPILALFYLPINPISIIANFIALFIVNFLLLPLTFIITFLYFINLNLPTLIHLNNLISNYLFDILFYIDLLVKPYFLHLNIFLIIFSIFILIPNFFGKKLIIFLLIPVFFNNHLKKGEVRIEMLDVGQGQAILIQTKNGNFLYDTGPKFNKYTAAQFIIKPILNYLNIQKLNTVIVSHEDLDHSGGIEFLKKNLKIDKIINQYNCLLNDFIFDEVIFSFWQYQKASNNNDASCVLHIKANNFTMLFTGDLTRKAELSLIKERKDFFPVTALQVSHHGSNSSTSQEFINIAQPKFSFASAGRNNTYNHPSEKVKERLKKINSLWFDTKTSGSISWKMKDKEKPIQKKRFYKKNN